MQEDIDAVEIVYQLFTPVRDDLYEYITEHDFIIPHDSRYSGMSVQHVSLECHRVFSVLVQHRLCAGAA